ncbi:MAG: DUF4307 domain-containing protein [Brachybacterium sp.]|nr:DUF4307 domain-containing protein [Brachybacterium sp.]
MSTSSPRLDARYGAPADRDRTRRRNRLLGALAAVLLLAVVAWVGVQYAVQPVRFETFGYEHLSDSEMEVTFHVTMSPGTEATCQVQALNSNRGQIGFREVEIPAQEQRTTAHRVVVTTQGEAVSGEVMDCSPRG